MIINIYRLASPSDLQPGEDTIDTPKGPLLVDEVRRRDGQVVIYGHRGPGSRRMSVTVKPTDDVAVLPAAVEAPLVWSLIVDAVRFAASTWVKQRHDAAGPDGELVTSAAAPWSANSDTVLVRPGPDAGGHEFWVEVDQPPPPADDDEPS